MKITDFSLGFFLDHDSTTLTKSSQLIGTEGYIAPEIFRLGGHQASKLSDIYSIGCTLWFMFSGGMNPQYYNPQGLNPNIVRIIAKCRETDPTARYATVQEVIDELKALQTPIQYLSIKGLIGQESILSRAEFRKNAYQLLLKNERWSELIKDIKLLNNSRLKDIILNVPEAGSSILLLLENIYNNDTKDWRQFEDIDYFTDLCALVFSSTPDILSKQKAIELTLEFSINNTRWPAMRVIRERMLNKLTDVDVRQLTGFLRVNKEMLESLEDNIGLKLNRNVRIAAGME